MQEQQNNPLHGKRLDEIILALVEHFDGWEGLGKKIDIKCFNHDPNLKSSLVFLRKTPWARTKVEKLYLKVLKDDERK